MTAVAFVGGTSSPGSRHYRSVLPAKLLEARGWSVEVCANAGSRPDGAIFAVIERDGTSWPWVPDVVVLQRVADPMGAKHVAQARAIGQKVLVDADDDLSRMPPNNYGALSMGSVRQWLHALPAADGLLCATEALRQSLARRARRAVVAPNLFDPDRFSRGEAGEPGPLRSLGWVGNTVVHADDLAELRGVLGPFLVKHDLRFRWCGQVTDEPPDFFCKLTGCPVDRLDPTPGVDFADYPKVAFDGIDLGLVPLSRGAFTQAKTSTKGLEFAAAGVPFLHSRHPSYFEFGRGQRCAADWRKALEGAVRFWPMEPVRLAQREVMESYAATSGHAWLAAFDSLVR